MEDESGVGAVFEINLALGYNGLVNPASQAASLMGRRSVDARIKAWGKHEFERRLREWGKLGGRPKGMGKEKRKAVSDGGLPTSI
jgi:hypothetical protein